MRSRRVSRSIVAVTASGLITVLGATAAQAAELPVDDVADDTAQLDQEIPETVLGGLLDNVLVTLQDLLPGLLGGLVPVAPTDVAPLPSLAAAAPEQIQPPPLPPVPEPGVVDPGTPAPPGLGPPALPAPNVPTGPDVPIDCSAVPPVDPALADPGLAAPALPAPGLPVAGQPAPALPGSEQPGPVLPAAPLAGTALPGQPPLPDPCLPADVPGGAPALTDPGTLLPGAPAGADPAAALPVGAAPSGSAG
jgi:hypothetical protein